MIRGAGSPSVAIALRGIVLACLLFGPLLVAEHWIRGQIALLSPYLIGPADWPDAKLMLIERAGCPQVLSLGSSVTNRTLVSKLTARQELPFDESVEPVRRVFAFGLNGARATHMYGAWRHIHQRGCTPDYVFVEVLPNTLNGRQSHPMLLRPFLDAATAFAMPSGYAREAGFGTTEVLDAVTWGRLALDRLRVPLLGALSELLKLAPPPVFEQPLPLDGMIRPLGDQDITHERFAEERALRLRLARKGVYRTLPSRVQTEALEKLVRDAGAAGSRVVLHSPPVTSIYHEIVDQTNGHEAFCDLRAALPKRTEAPWYWAYDGDEFGAEDFMDWNHLNRRGGQQYVRQLFRSVRNGTYGEDGWCADVRKNR